jgi:hypothetical protein
MPLASSALHSITSSARPSNGIGMVSPRLKARFAELGGAPMPMTPKAFRDLVAAETGKWAKVVKFAGIRPQ